MVSILLPAAVGTGWGGIIGRVAPSGAVTINRCYNSGSSDWAAGNGLYYASWGGGVTVNYSYWRKDTVVAPLWNTHITDDGNQKTAAWMQTQANYPVIPGTANGWDFTTVWFPPAGAAYPTLR